MVTLDLRTLHTTLVLLGANFNIVAHLVFSATGRDMDHVWVDGRLAVERGRLLTMDADEIRIQAHAAAEELFDRMARSLDEPRPGPSVDMQTCIQIRSPRACGGRR